MNRGTVSRLSKLETQQPPDCLPRYFRVIGNTDAELDASIAALIASGEATEADAFIRRLIVTSAAESACKNKFETSEV